MVLMEAYESLATQRRLAPLLKASYFDERVYDVLARHQLNEEVTKMLPDPFAARYLARGICYEPVNLAAMKSIVAIASRLARYETVSEGSALAELLGNMSIPENHRMELFNFSETWRHLILSRNIFAQRACMKNLSYLFSDDFLQDAVAVLQYKSDILNHVNRLFIDTPDLVAWRFSVRVMSLAGGYNECRNDVAKTDRFTFLLTRVLPEWIGFYCITFPYARLRHRPIRMEGKIPKWLSNSRARFSATVCASLGVFTSTFLEWRLYVMRQRYEAQYMTEMRRRDAAVRRGIEYKKNSYFDNLEGITRRVWVTQLQHYVGGAAILALSCAPSRYIKFPQMFGDVVFRFPWMGRWFPAITGQYASSKCAIPYIVFPFAVATGINVSMAGAAPLYDTYVHQRYMWWKRFRGADSVPDTPTPPP